MRRCWPDTNVSNTNTVNNNNKRACLGNVGADLEDDIDPALVNFLDERIHAKRKLKVPRNAIIENNALPLGRLQGNHLVALKVRQIALLMKRNVVHNGRPVRVASRSTHHQICDHKIRHKPQRQSLPSDRPRRSSGAP